MRKKCAYYICVIAITGLLKAQIVAGVTIIRDNELPPNQGKK